MSSCSTNGFDPCDPCGGAGRRGTWTAGGWTGGPIEAGPGLHIEASGNAFIFVNGELDPPFQTLHFTARISGVEVEVDWVAEPAIKNLGQSSTFSLNSEEMGDRKFASITAFASNGEARTIFILASADPFATIGAPPGTPVGTRFAEDVLADIEKTKQDITDLFQSFGNSESAAENAALVQAIAEAVERAQEAAEEAVRLTDIARDDAIEEAQRAFSEADRAAENALMSEQLSEATTLVANLAASARDQAVQSAQEAAGSATVALSHKEDSFTAKEDAEEAAATAQSPSSKVVGRYQPVALDALLHR